MTLKGFQKDCKLIRDRYAISDAEPAYTKVVYGQYVRWEYCGIIVTGELDTDNNVISVSINDTNTGRTYSQEYMTDMQLFTFLCYVFHV